MEFLTIIEYDFKNPDTEGCYIRGTDLIFVHNITDKRAILHEITHYLWDKKDKQLELLLKSIGLNFNSKNDEVINNYYIKGATNIKTIQALYEPNNWFDEATAYYVSDAPEEFIRMLEIPLLNAVLDGEFYYYDSNGGLYHMSRGFTDYFDQDVKKIVDDFKRIR